MAKHIEVNGNLEVKKADVIVKARYKLNPLSLKFITSLIAGLRRGDEPNELYIFRVKDFKELTGLKRKDLYWAVKEALKELLEKPIYIPKGQDNSFLMLNWIASGEYKEGEGIVEFEISQKLRPYLLEAQKKFLKYKLENILSLRSSYSIRMYEILKDWLELSARYGNKAQKIISLKEFREILEIPHTYLYGNSSGIKKRILERAQKELAKSTDIIFTFEEIKTGRKVTHLRFSIFPNPEKLKEPSQKTYLKSFKNFVTFLRERWSGNMKFFFYAKDVKTGRPSFFGLDRGGRLYAASGEDITDYSAQESLDEYRYLYTLFKNSEPWQEVLEKELDVLEIKKTRPEFFELLMKEAQEIIQREPQTV